MKLLDVTMETPFFVMMTIKCLFYSPPHLLKSVRNNLKNHDFSPGQQSNMVEIY